MRLNLLLKLLSLLFFFVTTWSTTTAQTHQDQLINYLEIEDDRYCDGLVELSSDALNLADRLYRFETSEQQKPFQELSLNAQQQQLSGQYKVSSFHLAQSTTLQLPDDLIILSQGDVVLEGNIIGSALKSSKRDGQHLVIKSEGKIIIRGDISLSSGLDGQAQQDLLVNHTAERQNYLLGTGYLASSIYAHRTDENRIEGGLGGSILLCAKEIIIEGLVQSGNGGNSLYDRAGGTGGSITLLSGNTYNKYDLKAGDGGYGRPGGDGGDAISLWTTNPRADYLGCSGDMIGGDGGNAMSFFNNGTDGTNDGPGTGNRFGGHGGDATSAGGGNDGDDGGDGGNGISTDANGTGGDGGDGRLSDIGVDPGGDGGDGGNGVGGDSPTGGGDGVGGKGGKGGAGNTGGRSGGDGGEGGDGIGGNTTSTGSGGNATGGNGGSGGNALGGAPGTGGDGGDGGSALGGNGVTIGTGACGTGGFAGSGSPDGSNGSDGFICLNGILPVELIAFKAKVQNDMVELSWSTASEINNDFFQIEYSRDGTAFSAIGKVKGQGTTTETVQYNFRHRQPMSGTNYYRLKQVDFDGAFQYSEIISIQLDKNRGQRGFSLAPNPSSSNGNLILYFEIANKGRLTIYNQLGAKVYQQSMPEALNQIELNLPNLPAGMYAIELINDRERFIEQLVIQ